MTYNEETAYYKMINRLLAVHGFTFVRAEEDLSVCWLEKKQNGITHVVKLNYRTFTWANHLKQDILKTANQIQNMSKGLFAKKTRIHNVYFGEQEPADEWSKLKKPMIIKSKRPIPMQLYYLDGGSYEKESEKLFRHLKLDDKVTLISADEQELEVEKGRLRSLLVQQQQADQAVFHRKKPLLVYGLIGICVVMFLLETLLGGSTDSTVLIELGAKHNPLILAENEWWRIVSSMFLHIGALHLLTNMLSLYYLGTLTEQIFGHRRFLLIYLLGGLIGGLASFAFSDNLSAGASGAIFGLFGALIYFGVVYPKLFWRTIGNGLIVILLINLVISFSASHVIDVFAHLGGLVGGFASALLVGLPGKRNTRARIGGTLLSIALIAGLIWYGLTGSVNDTLRHVLKVEDAVKQNDYSSVISDSTLALDEGDSVYEPMLLFNRGLAYYKTGDIEKSAQDYERLVKLTPEDHAAHYNLALVLQTEGKKEEALKHAKRAVELAPDESQYEQLQQKLSQ
ncbi:rhomboid family intramembrane serine protease [Terribacillus sp. AE2B 122]|uniref:rhomboid family intramembrane serine protease n=1 Tax=Terribacillus sp. AE2B 122 TaxID=1331902 RepID=UPI001583C3F7|nr:rhomboid family intramembrane serine protease [Terribacillus sp. AE2B 122]